MSNFATPPPPFADVISKNQEFVEECQPKPGYIGGMYTLEVIHTHFMDGP